MIELKLFESEPFKIDNPFKYLRTLTNMLLIFNDCNNMVEDNENASFDLSFDLRVISYDESEEVFVTLYTRESVLRLKEQIQEQIREQLYKKAL